MKIIKTLKNFISSESINEGQFSWMTQDTDTQIGSEKQNTIKVYMYDNEGNQWFEKKYDGYGEFGGMDYYTLLAKMNGYSEEDLSKKGMEMRDLGIDLAFKKLKTKIKGGKVLFPALVEDPRFNWKRHDFTQEAESDEYQSWYQEPEYDDYEDDDDYEQGWYESAFVDFKSFLAINEARQAPAKTLFKMVVKGSTSEIEGVKISKDMAQAALDWFDGSVYARKYEKQVKTAGMGAVAPLIFGDNWGIKKRIPSKLRNEFKELQTQYKRVMPENESVHEAKRSTVHKAAKKGSYPAVIVVVQDGEVIHQEPVSTPDVAPATFNVMQEKYPKALLHLEDNTGKRLFSESVINEAKMFYLIGDKEVSRDEMLTYKYDNKDKPVADNGWPKWLYTNNDPKGKTLKWSTIKKDMKGLEKHYGEGNVVVGGRTNAGGPYIEIYSKSQNESVNEGISVSDERHFGKKGIIIMIDDNGKKVSAIFKDKKNADKFNRNKSSDIQKLLQLAKETKYPKAIDESVVTEAENYDTKGFKVGDKIKTNFGEWEVIETDYAPNKSFMAPFIFKGKDMKRVDIPNPPKTNKNAVGYKVTDGGKYPIIGFLYQYKDITKLATVGVDESVVNEKLARGLKPLLTLGLNITKKVGEDALLDLSDKFDALGDEDSDSIASHLNMAIELMQDGYAGDATKKLKQFNKACRDILSGKEVGSAFESQVNEGEFDYIDVKDLHFETDEERAEDMKIELGKRQGEVIPRKQIEGGNYSLRRFRKEIKYDTTGEDLGVFKPGSYMAATSKLGDGPHKKAVAKVKWNRKKYDQWLEDVASNDGWRNAYDMAQNAKHELGLLQWAKKEFRGEDVMQRIQWDIEAFAESVVTEAKVSLDNLMDFVSKHLKFVKTSEEFDGTEGGLWASAEDGDMYKGKRIYDYYAENHKSYTFGVLNVWEKELNKRGYYSEYYDAGTVMIWEE